MAVTFGGGRLLSGLFNKCYKKAITFEWAATWRGRLLSDFTVFHRKKIRLSYITFLAVAYPPVDVFCIFTRKIESYISALH